MPRVRLAKVRRALPRHSHDLDRETVVESQRWRIIEAMIEVASRVGPAEASVADVIGRAGVSRKTFYEHFTDKEECFLAAYEVLSERLIADLAAASSSGGRNHQRLQLGRFLEVLGRDLVVARVFMVDVLAAGPKALARRAEVNRRFGEAFVADLKVEQVRINAIIGGINQVVAQHLLEGGKDPSSLLEPLSRFVAAALS